MSFAEALQVELSRVGMSQWQAARELGIAQQTMNSYVTGARAPQHAVLLRMLKLFPGLRVWVIDETHK